jgi:hypothetical protein
MSNDQLPPQSQNAAAIPAETAAPEKPGTRPAQISEMRRQGLSWPAITARMNGITGLALGEDAYRKALARSPKTGRAKGNSMKPHRPRTSPPVSELAILHYCLPSQQWFRPTVNPSEPLDDPLPREGAPRKPRIVFVSSTTGCEDSIMPCVVLAAFCAINGLDLLAIDGDPVSRSLSKWFGGRHVLALDWRVSAAALAAGIVMEASRRDYVLVNIGPAHLGTAAPAAMIRATLASAAARGIEVAVTCAVGLHCSDLDRWLVRWFSSIEDSAHKMIFAEAGNATEIASALSFLDVHKIAMPKIPEWVKDELCKSRPYDFVSIRKTSVETLSNSLLFFLESSSNIFDSSVWKEYFGDTSTDGKFYFERAKSITQKPWIDIDNRAHNEEKRKLRTEINRVFGKLWNLSSTVDDKDILNFVRELLSYRDVYSRFETNTDATVAPSENSDLKRCDHADSQRTSA